jgi:hypothetical protein
MDKKGEKITAVAIVIFVIVASLAIAIATNPQPRSEARAMILDSNDVKAFLDLKLDKDQRVMPYDVNTYFINETSAASCYMSNETIDQIWISLRVFENESACNAAFLTSVNPSHNATVPQIGNESYSYKGNGSHGVFLSFREGRVAVWFKFLRLHDPADWLYDSAISLAQLQLEKIDQYIAG